ncbi:hypothetical protein RHMOL_Rhmol01G0138800 [Rhododendron molle]|uniref:Uncharacterized protein n=1 Tax=Rhododendron molle TaxID=49168 RepID=A0ACC0Q4K0_RHOML|nr:hypothetical protein RHMOL_Rhmol01G0138800 [Rhododendron molle]
MACDILSIPITLVALEFTFSAGGRVIDPYRASLAIETVEMLLCGADYVHTYHGLKKGSDVSEICLFMFSYPLMLIIYILMNFLLFFLIDQRAISQRVHSTLME